MDNKNITSATESETRSIKVVDDKIIYRLKIDGVADYVTYNDTLYEILKLNRVIPFRNNGRLQFDVWENHSRVKFYMHDLAFACYQGLISVDNFLEDIQAYYDNKRKYGLSIDHADNNPHNNTVFNLSFMEIGLNTSKGSIVAKVKEPVYLISAYCNGKYRIQMLFEDTQNKMSKIVNRFTDKFTNFVGGQFAIHFVCDTPEKYVECLKWLTETKFEWAEPIKILGHWIKNDNNCWCLNINNSMHAQKALSLLPDSLFQPF